MESLTQYVVDHGQFFWSLLAALAAILIALAIITIPAYFIFFPIARRLRDALHSYSTELRQRHATRTEDRRCGMKSAVSDFAENSGITVLSERTARLEAAVASFSDVAHTLSGHLNRVTAAPQAFGPVAARPPDTAA